MNVGAKRKYASVSKKLLAEPVFSLQAVVCHVLWLHYFWEELDRFSASETDLALQHLAVRIKGLLSADNVRWLAAVRVLHGAEARKDSLKGWRLRARYDLVPDPEEYYRLLAWLFQRHNRINSDFAIGLATHALIAGFGKFQVHRMRDGWISYDEFSQSTHYPVHYTKLDITDRIWLSFPLNADTESVFLIDRVGERPHFSKEDAALAAAILRGIRGFHRRLFLNRGLLIGDSPLSPVACRIVQKLLTGMSEKEIAASMGQRLCTTHEYIKTIYERFGVNARPQLMALWLRE